jgi:hypothetical protein
MTREASTLGCRWGRRRREPRPMANDGTVRCGEQWHGLRTLVFNELGWCRRLTVADCKRKTKRRGTEGPASPSPRVANCNHACVDVQNRLHATFVEFMIILTYGRVPIMELKCMEQRTDEGKVQGMWCMFSFWPAILGGGLMRVHCICAYGWMGVESILDAGKGKRG